jgi:hypothetical protein
MKIAAGILGILGGIFGSIAAFVTLFLGGLGGAFGAEGASTVVGLGWGGLLFSIVSIVFGALAFGKLRAAGYGLVISSILGGILGGTLVGICMIFPLVGGILALVGSREQKRSKGAVSEREASHSVTEEEISKPMIEKETSQPMFCTFCGTPNEAGDSFCIKCGKPLTPTSEREASHSVAEKEISKPMIEKETSQPMFCTFCGTPNEAGDSFCIRCGEPLTPISERETSHPMAEEEIPKPMIEEETLGARGPVQIPVSERETFRSKGLTQNTVTAKRTLSAREPTQRMILQAMKTMPTGTKILIAMGGVVIILLFITVGLSREKGKTLLSEGANPKLSEKLVSSTPADNSVKSGMSTRKNQIKTVVVEIATPTVHGALITTGHGKFFLLVSNPRGKEIIELLQESQERKSPVIITYEEGDVIANVEPAISG